MSITRRLATILQLEGSLTVAEGADRLGVARSTAHRLLQMLVYRDFATQAADKSYRPGPVIELAAHSRSDIAALRAASLPALHRLVDIVEESANVAIRVGATARFIASVECRQALRVGTREGMVFTAHQSTAGMLLLAELDPHEVTMIYDTADLTTHKRPVARNLSRSLTLIRRQGFAVNRDESERGVTAVGVLVRESDATGVAAVSIALPSVRYDTARLESLTGALRTTARSIQRDLLTQSARSIQR